MVVYGQALSADWQEQIRSFPHPVDGSAVLSSVEWPTGEPGTIILFHGLGNSGAVFGPLIPALGGISSAIAPTIRPDLFDGKPASRSALMAPLVTYLSQLAEPPWFLVGHSMGGVIAGMLLRSRPDLVSGCVLVSAPLPGLVRRIAGRPRMDRTGRALILLNALARISSVAKPSFPGRLSSLELPLARLALRGFMHRPADLDTEVLKVAVLRSRTQDGLRQLELAKAMPEWTHDPCDYRNLSILVGQEDPLLTTADYEVIRASYPMTSFEVVADAAHFVHLERPTEVVEAVRILYK